MRVVVIVAVYNNVSSILGVLDELAQSELPIIVVNDGSDDGTADVLDGWSKTERGSGNHVCHLAANKGKAAALRAGFDWAHELSFTHGLTFDADGQHDASRIEAFLQQLDKRGPDVLIVGTREPLARKYPIRNRIGRFMSNLAIRAQCGVGHGDVPCGMRIYPVQRVRSVRCISGRFAWEEEFITRAVWAGCSVGSVQIPSIYAPKGERQSHYKFRRDWTEGIAIFVWLLLISLLPSIKPGAWCRHARLFLMSRNAPFFKPMSLRTEWLFLAASFFVLAVALLLLLPFSWVVVIMIVWLGLAWHMSGVVMALMLGVSVVGLFAPELARALSGLAGVVSFSLGALIIIGWLGNG